MPARSMLSSAFRRPARQVMRDRGDGGTGGQALFKVYALESHGSYMVAFCQRLKSAVIFTSIPLDVTELSKPYSMFVVSWWSLYVVTQLLKRSWISMFLSLPVSFGNYL